MKELEEGKRYSLWQVCGSNVYYYKGTVVFNMENYIEFEDRRDGTIFLKKSHIVRYEEVRE